MANYKLLVQGVIDPAGIQTQLANLGKDTKITIHATGARQEVEKLKTSLYETVTTTRKLNKENELLSEKTTTTTSGIRQQNDLLKQQLAIQKTISTERSRQYAENYQSGVNQVFAPGLIPNPHRITEANSQFTKLFDTTKEGYLKLSPLERKVLDLNGGIKKAGNATDTFTGSIKHAIKAATLWGVAMGLLYGTLRKVQEGIKFVYEFDNQMNKIQMVTKSTNEETKALAVTYANIAEQLSSTTMDVARNAEEWLRQGRTIAETNQLIKTSMIFSKVGFLDSAEAASLLTASINGYKLSAQEAMSVVDKMSAIDVAAATSTADLATALSYTATSAKLAGLELDEVLSYIAVVSDVTQQSAETIGNSFKTIFARMQQVKIGALVDEEGEDISNTSKVLESYGIQLADMTTGTFRDLGDVLGELANKWETLTNMQRSEIAGAIAGVRQRERFIVLMDNYDKALKYQKISLESAGSAMEKFNIYQESGEAATQRLTTAFQKLFMDMDAGIIKGFLNAATSILTFIDNIGGLNTILMVTIGLIAILKGELILTPLIYAFAHLTTAMAIAAETGTSLIAVLRGVATAAGTLKLALGGALALIVAVFAGSAAYYNNLEKVHQKTLENVAAFNLQTQSLSGLKTKIDEATSSQYTELEQREGLLTIIGQISDAYVDEAKKIQNVTDLRIFAIEKMKEEQQFAASSFLSMNMDQVKKARAYFGESASDEKEYIVKLQKELMALQKKSTDGGKLSWLDKTRLKGLPETIKQLQDLYDKNIDVFNQAIVAESILAGVPTTSSDKPKETEAEKVDRIKPKTEAEIAKEEEERKLAEEEAAKAAEEAQKKLEKLNQEYLERLIKLKLKAISDESVAATKLYDDQINALKKINQERQDEIDLIKAKEALLRAQTQKRMVYRAGMGFVAEVDQSAIKEAQENIIKIETEAKIAELEAKKVTAEESGKAKEQAYRNTLLQQMKAESRPYMQEVYGSFLGLTKGTDEHWYDSDGKRAFKHGGIVNFTGTAMVHGKPNEPEVMINNSQASALFKFIQGLTNPSMTRNPVLAGAGGQNVYISNVNLPSVKDGYGFIKELSLISKNRS